MIFMPYYFFFICSILFGIFISISRSTWLYIWIGLEVNLLSFIPLIVCGSNDIESEGAIKYFLIQALGSCIILFSYFSFINFVNYYLYIFNFGSYILIFGLILKIGIFPFHHWLPQVMGSVSWFNCFILSVVQKLAPSFVLCFIMCGHSSNIILLLGILGALFGGLNGINQTQIRVILAYSSVGHLGWILCSIFISFFVFIYYYLIYVFIRSGLILLLNVSPFKIINLNRFNYVRPAYVVCISLRFLSLSGLPPFLGFYSKLLVIYYIIYFGKGLYCLGLIVGSLINLFYYLRIFFNIFILSSFKRAYIKNVIIFRPFRFLISFFLRISYLGFGFLYLFF